ncbi:MAG: flippase-like domain-containing protein [Actinobacteria bacterium]|nr:flippase-like domain-containing protein [Actinomycetota bacterium]
MGAAEGGPGAGGRPAWRWLGWALSIAVLVATVLAVRGRWAETADATWPAAGWVLAAVGVNVLGNLLLVDAWRATTALAGPRLPLLVATDVWGSAQLTRLVLPAAPVASRAALAAPHGVRPGIGALTTLVEFAWMLVGTPALALATAPWWLADAPRDLAWVAAFAVVPVAAVVAIVVWPTRMLTLLAATLERIPFLGPRLAGTAAAVRSAPLTRRLAVALLGRYAATTVLRLAGFLLLAVGLVGGGEVGDLFAVLVGAAALGRFVGTVALFAPGGIGPREGVTALVLGPHLGSGPVLVLVALARLVELAAEVVLLVVVRLARGVRRGGVRDSTSS